ncbi:hypothetical protein [Chromatocurvus halotolerans]|uniref:Uncharacterized protein n=1 Tax=Chromatocurvus halotolerans TaxID=1132028 RepID=A0A4V2SBX0_9GAMM|nr:hypothetical protein [Chromatocurvus halotolerans]TCO77150.1 hypothetical protein EV688_103164 [Chromatocurvus halotolerans]
MDILISILWVGAVVFGIVWLWNLFGYLRCKSYIERVIGAMEAQGTPNRVVETFMGILELRYGRARNKKMLNSINAAKAAGKPPSEFAEEVYTFIVSDSSFDIF